MFKQIIFNAIQKRWIIVLLFLSIAVLGILSWKQLSVEAYPDIADVSAQVVTQVDGLAAEEIELQITIPLERALNGLPGLEVMRSNSTFGLSIITLVFQDGADDYFVRQLILERILDIDLPYNAQPALDPLTSPIGEVYRYIIESDHHSLQELTDLQHFTIIPKLRELQGIAEVTNFGGKTSQYQVNINPQLLGQYDLTLTDVIEAIENNNINAGGSQMMRGDLAYVIRGVGLIEHLEDLGNIVIKNDQGGPILISDIASLEIGYLERKGILGYQDRSRNYSESIQGIILLLKGEDSGPILQKIQATIQELNQDILPEGVNIHTVLDRTELIHTTLSTVSRTMIGGISLVIILLIIFLNNWRGALLVAITIPISLLVAFILMRVTNIPANLLSLGAIDFGIIVDGAIVMMENLLRKREEDPETTFTEKTIGQQALKVARPIFFATLIIMIAYLPLFAFERVESKLFQPMAFTVGFALIGALLVALLLIPALSYMIYKKPLKIKKIKWIKKAEIRYRKQVIKILEAPKKAFYALGIIFIGAVLLSVIVGKDFLPELDEGSIWLQVQLPPGISFQKAQQMSDTLRARTMKYDEVTYIMVQAGRNDDGTDPWTMAHFEVSIGLKPYKEWPKGKVKKDLINELTKEYASLPGLNVGFTQPMIDGVMDKISGAHSELVVKLFGDDLKETREVAEQVVNVLKTVPGAVDIAIDQAPPLPQVQIIPDKKALAYYGVNISEIMNLIEVAIGGKPVSKVFLGNKFYEITTRYAESFRASPESLSQLKIKNDHGQEITLEALTELKVTQGESTISREHNQRHLTVKLNIRNRDLGSLLKEAQTKLTQELNFDHQHIRLEWGGQFENKNRAYNRLAVVVPLTILLMFLIIYAAFGKVHQAMIIIGILPLALFGGMLALNIRGMTLNVSSAVGFIALFGVAIQNGIIMFSHINDLRHKMDLKRAVIYGTKQRLRPVLMTATVAALGLLPASMATGIGSDIQRPLATVIVYGLIFSTLVTLYLLPALYYYWEKRIILKNK